MPLLCLCFPLGSEEVALIRMGMCLHGLVPAGAVSGEAVDEVDGRSSRLPLEHQCRLQMERGSAVATETAVVQDA